MQEKFKYLYFLVLIVFFWSCSKPEALESKFVKLEAFDKIAFNNPFDIYLTEDTCYSLEIIADGDRIKNIDYSLVDSVLTLTNRTKFKWLKPTKNKIEIYIHSKPLKKVWLNETCHLHTLNPITSESFGLILKSKMNEATLDLDCRGFYYWNNFPCGGKLTLKGKAHHIKLWNYAILTIDAQELTTQEALVENNSQGDCTVNVSEELVYSITNSGNINLYGNPNRVIKNEISSSGRLVIK